MNLLQIGKIININHKAFALSIIFTNEENLLFGLSSKDWGESNSTIYPLSTTSILFEDIMVLIL